MVDSVLVSAARILYAFVGTFQSCRVASVAPAEMSRGDCAAAATFFEERTPSASLLYGAAVAYLVKAGWRRMELGSGWWWREGMDEATVGDALDQQLEADGIDFRTALIGEPEEFCG